MPTPPLSESTLARFANMTPAELGRELAHTRHRLAHLEHVVDGLAAGPAPARPPVAKASDAPPAGGEPSSEKPVTGEPAAAPAKVAVQ